MAEIHSQRSQQRSLQAPPPHYTHSNHKNMIAFILSFIVLLLLGLLVRELVSMAREAGGLGEDDEDRKAEDEAFRHIENWREGQ